MSLFMYFLRQASSDFANRKGFTLTVTTTMTLALTAFILVGTLMYTVFIKSLPYKQSDQLMVVHHQLINDEPAVDGDAFIYPNMEYLYSEQQAFDTSAMLYLDADVITSQPEQPMVEIKYVTPEWFSLFPAHMAKGRHFSQTEVRNSYHPVVILTYEMWQDEFAGRADILAQAITFGGRTYKVIGVLPQNYQAPKLYGAWSNVGLYVPWDFNSVREEDRHAWGNDDSSLMFIGTLKQGITQQQVNQSLTQLVNDNWQQKVADDSFFRGWSINVMAVPLKAYMTGSAKESLYLLSVGILGLVLISAINIANLFTAKIASQSQNMAIAVAIGAKKRHVRMQVLAQSTLLMVLACALATLIAYLILPWINSAIASYIPRSQELGIYAEVLMIGWGLALLIALGLASSASGAINYNAIQKSLSSSGKGTGVQVSTSIRQAMISLQVAIASILLFINISLVFDGVALLNKPLGYQVHHRSFAVLALPDSNSSLRANVMKEVIEAVSSLPMVVEVSQGLRPSSFTIRGMVSTITNKSHSFLSKGVDHKYFPMMGYEFIEGDNFSEQAFESHERLAVVNESLANVLSKDGEVLGYTFTNGLRVVGVVKDIIVPGDYASVPRLYTLTLPSRNMMVIQTQENQALSRSLLIDTIKQVDPSLSLFSYESLLENRERRLLHNRVTIYSAIGITVITILLALVGLYGVFNMTSLMRQNEFATRMAVGAKRAAIVHLMLKDNLSVTAIGMLISLLLAGLLYSAGIVIPQIIAMDYVLYCLIAALILVFMLLLLSTYLPLRRLFSQPLRVIFTAS